MKKIGILHGPNLNMLGKREPELYGKTTLAKVNRDLQKVAKTMTMELTILQSNHEGELINFIQKQVGKIDLMMVNPAALTHTSIAIRDALLLLDCPIIEVHITNIFQREEFRQHSFISDIATGVISGFGVEGYFLALQAAKSILKK